jgi:hypothetical protein
VDLTTVTAERTVLFPGMAGTVVVKAVGKAAA